MSHLSSSTERNNSIIAVFCVAGLVSAGVTLRLLKSFPELLLRPSLDSGVPLKSFMLALMGPGMPFAALMLIAGAIVVKRGLVNLLYPPDLWQLVVGTCLMAYAYHAGVGLVGSMMLLSVAVPWAVTMPLGFLLAGAGTVLLAAGAIRIVTDAVPPRIWIWMLGFGIGVALVAVASTGMDVDKFDVPHLKSLVLVESVLAGVIGHWLVIVAETRPRE